MTVGEGEFIMGQIWLHFRMITYYTCYQLLIAKNIIQELDIEEEFGNGEDYESNDVTGDDDLVDDSNYNSGDNYYQHSTQVSASHLRY